MKFSQKPARAPRNAAAKLMAGAILGVAIAAFAGATAEGQTLGARGAPVAGKAIADRWCSNCHLVSEGQARASADVPTFASLAKRLPNDAEFLTGFITNPHPPMPNMGLSRQDIADVLAFIATLK